MINKFKALNKSFKVLLLIILVVLLVLTFLLSYAFLGPIIGDVAKTPISVQGAGQESLTFVEGADLSLNINPDNFGTAGSHVRGTTTLSAYAKGNKSGETYTTSYNVFFQILVNNFEYSSGSTAEILLKITDPTGVEVTSITGLTRTTQGGVTGFDITTKTGNIVVAEDYSISNSNFNSPTEQEWTFEVIVIAHTFDQSINLNKTFNAKVEGTHNDTASVFPDITVSSVFTNSLSSSLLNVTCSNAGAIWNPKYRRFEISDLAAFETCDARFTDSSSSLDYLDDYVVSLAGSGEVFDENGYRYQGKDPDNYIWFNNELWRIIGVFDTTLADGVTTERLTKIIRADSMGSLAWDAGSVNNWELADLNILLNGAYLNSENGTNDGVSPDNCYGYSTSVPGNCDYTVNGIKSDYRGFIENVTWHLGAGSTSSQTAASFYAEERSNVVYSGRPETEAGYVGLMYMSDYGYSVKAADCTRTTNLGSYKTSSCAGKSWLYKEGYEWTIVPYLFYSSRVWGVHNDGYAYYDSAISGLAVRPVLHLTSNTKVLAGNGDITNPYIITG